MYPVHTARRPCEEDPRPNCGPYASSEHILSCGTVEEIGCTLKIAHTMANAIMGA